MTVSADEGMEQGFERGMAAAEAIVRDLKSRGHDKDFVFAYLASQMAGVLGYAAARLGQSSTRALLKTVNATFEVGVQIAESGASSRVQ